MKDAKFPMEISAIAYSSAFSFIVVFYALQESPQPVIGLAAFICLIGAFSCVVFYPSETQGYN